MTFGENPFETLISFQIIENNNLNIHPVTLSRQANKPAGDVRKIFKEAGNVVKIKQSNFSSQGEAPKVIIFECETS